jgi:hypothetical protein
MKSLVFVTHASIIMYDTVYVLLYMYLLTHCRNPAVGVFAHVGQGYVTICLCKTSAGVGFLVSSHRAALCVADGRKRGRLDACVMLCCRLPTCVHSLADMLLHNAASTYYSDCA